MMVKLSYICVLFASFALSAAPLKIHFLDVANGDCEIICSPDGKNILVDAGSETPAKCREIIDFCNAKNIQRFDYAIISNYNPDHISCIPGLKDRLSPTAVVYDRGSGKDDEAFVNYKNAVALKRKTASKGDKITLDNGKLAIVIAALNGNGVRDVASEKDLSLVAILHYGSFDASFGGDLSGYDSTYYRNIETSVAPLVGGIEVYKVHNHCSKNTTNPVWLHGTHPRVAILSVGPSASFKHPNEYCVERLHDAGIDCYWTEKGAGVPPDSNDHVWGTITIEVNDAGTSYTVSGSGGSKNYQSWPAVPSAIPDNKVASPVAASGPRYEWSVKGSYYHVRGCPTTQTILEENRRSGEAPPADKKKHTCVK
jgi:competence protein ComEC